MPLYVVGGSVHAGVCAQVQMELMAEPPPPDLGGWARDYLNDCYRFTDPKDRRDPRTPDALADRELLAVANVTPADAIQTAMRIMLEETGR